MSDEIVPIGVFNPLEDPHPESTAFTNLKLYNHLVAHKRKGGKHLFCSIDCMTKLFEPRNVESNRKRMRLRLPAFQRWCRDNQGKFIVVPKGNNHGEALAAKLFDPLIADQRDRELIAADLNRALNRKEISDETYHKIFELVYPLLKENGEVAPPPESPTDERPQ
jgi:hypothetical protein